MRVVELPWLVVDCADGAQHEAIRSNDGCTGVKADRWRLCHLRVVAEAFIFKRVGDDHYLIGFNNGMRAEADIPTGLGIIETNPGLEPVTVGIDQRNQGDGRTAKLRHQADNVIEGPLRQGIENAVTMQRGEPLFFILWLGCDEHETEISRCWKTIDACCVSNHHLQPGLCHGHLRENP